MVTYYELGADKQLNEIVVAGSHDAGITQGGSNAQTQNLDIGGQALAGVRLFDLRIGGEDLGNVHGAGREVALRAYHGSVKKGAEPSYVKDLGRTKTADAGGMKFGTFGMGLGKMLQDAAGFVTSHPDEFLILKFDKCRNWGLIAEACATILGDKIFKGTGNLNKKTLRELRGKVIVLFTAEGIRAVARQYPPGSGILEIRNLKGDKDASKPYIENFHGMQYFGKGGTSLTNVLGDKIKENLKKQTKLMHKGAEGDPEVMGMMYWTSTGLLESIRDRNDKQWKVKNVSKLRRMWREGLSESIETRVAKYVDPTKHAYGNVLKAFMPNVVMIDFADNTKCRTIFELNYVAATSLTDAARSLDEEVKELQANFASLPRGARR